MIRERRKNLFDYLQRHYPRSAFEIKKGDLIGPHFFSPFLLNLPQSVFTQVRNFVKNVYKIKESDNYQSRLPKNVNWWKWPKTPSLLTCFDFHYSEEMGLKLIEINTNASLYISFHVFMEAQRDSEILWSGDRKGLTKKNSIFGDNPAKLENLNPDPEMKNLLKSFKKSLSLKPGDSIYILDREPKKEGLYFEFLLFQEWLERHGCKVKILPLEKYTGKEGKIYNRFTDFYFSKPESKVLKDDYINEKVIFSPSPREYFLLADKKRQRLLKEELKKINPESADIILQSKLFSEFENRDVLWSERKKYFFKPSGSHGSKGAFKGKSISRKTFNEINFPEFMAQELCPAGQKTFDYEGESVTLKFDLRFHVFEGEIQSYSARLYQGQTTNVKTKWGGWLPSIFSHLHNWLSANSG